MTERALVTGSEGFLGRSVRSTLVAAGIAVHGVGRRAVGLEPYTTLDLAASDAAERLARLLRDWQPNWVLHLAGGRGQNPLRDNLEPLRAVLVAIEQQRSSVRLVAIGSAAEYGDLGNARIRETARELPVSEYGVAKLAAARLVLLARRKGLDACVARVFNLIGAGISDDLAPGALLRELHLPGGDLRLRGSAALRDYLEVSEASRALVALARCSTSLPPIVNVCSGLGTRMSDLFAEIIAQSGLAAGRTIREDNEVGEIPVSIGDPQLFEETCGWRPTFELHSAALSMLAGGIAS